MAMVFIFPLWIIFLIAMILGIIFKKKIIWIPALVLVLLGLIWALIFFIKPM